MGKTLADCSFDERDQMVGMWYEMEVGKQSGLVVIIGNGTEFVEVLTPCDGWAGQAMPEFLTPRPDLPRAWNPDGSPVAGEWEVARSLFSSSARRRFVSEHEELPQESEAGNE